MTVSDWLGQAGQGRCSICTAQVFHFQAFARRELHRGGVRRAGIDPLELQLLPALIGGGARGVSQIKGAIRQGQVGAMPAQDLEG